MCLCVFNLFVWSSCLQSLSGESLHWQERILECGSVAALLIALLHQSLHVLFLLCIFPAFVD